MAYDFLDPNQENEFRKKATVGGVSINDIDKYISAKKSQASTSSSMDIVNAVQSGNLRLLDLPVEQRAGVATQMTKMGLKAPTEAENLTSEEKKQSYNAESGLRALTKINSILDTNPNKPGLEGKSQVLLSKLPLAPGARTYKTAINEIKDVLLRLRTGAQVNDQELKFYQSQLPGPLDSDDTIRYKLSIFSDLFSRFSPEYSMQIQSATGNQLPTSIPQSANTKNFSGSPAQQGDLMLNKQTGVMSSYGDITEPTVVKKATDKNIEVDNKLIEFLANSSFLPIAGGIIGSFLGAGVGSIATGAAGAMAGAGLKQGLIELLDPNKYDMSTHSRVLLTEGLTDAVFSGLTFGVIGVGAKGLKLVLQKPGAEALEAGAKEVVEKGLPIIGKRSTALAQAAKISTKEQTGFVKSFSKTKGFDKNLMKTALNIFDEAKLTKTITGPQELQVAGKIVREQAGEEIGTLLKGKMVDVRPTVQALYDLKAKGIVEGIESPAVKGAWEEIDNAIRRLFNAADDNFMAPGESFNTVKKELGQAFGSALEAGSASQKMTRQAYHEVMSSLEKAPGLEALKNSNMKNRVGELFYNPGMKQSSVTATSPKAAVNLVDIASGGVGTIAFGAPGLGMPFLIRLINTVTKDPYEKLKIGTYLLDIAKSANNKVAVRNILRAMQEVKGLRITIDPRLVKSAIRGTNIVGEAINQLKGNEIDPGMPPSTDSMLNLAPTQQGIDPNLQPQGGGVRRGMGMDLGAYSPEGAPLYR